MGYENFMEAGVRAQSQGREKREGESINELILNDPRSSYIAGMIFERNQQSGTEIADNLLQGIPLSDYERQETERMRDEIVKIKRDVEGVYEMMKQGRILEELSSVDRYFANIRKNVGLKNMSSVIKFEDLVQIRLDDEAGFGQLMINCQSYKDFTEDYVKSEEGKTAQSKLNRFMKMYEISQFKIEELMEIPLADQAKLKEKIKELVRSKVTRFNIKNLLLPETQLMEILKEERNVRAKQNVERHDIAMKLWNIIDDNDSVKIRIEQNIANISAQTPTQPKKELGFKDSGALFKEVVGLSEEKLFPGEAEEKEFIDYWENKYKPAVAKDLLGNDNLSLQEIEDYWRNLKSDEFTDEQNRCFDEYKNKFAEKREQKNEGFWFDRVMNLIRSFLGNKTIEDVNPSLRNKLSRVRRNPQQQKPQQNQNRRRGRA